jgi:hypothetical protein
MFSKTINTLLLASCATAAVLPALAVSNARLARRATSAADILLAIAPSSGSCSNAPAAGECATNVQAAPYLITALANYGVTNVNEIAAVLSVVAYESGDFKYNINHYPGRPGQGTRAMLMPSYVLEYVKSIPALASQTTASTTTGLSDSDLNAIRALVLPDDYTWGSAAWFLTTHCASARSGLQAGGQAGYSAYLTCLGVTATSDRLAYWTRATAAMATA